MKLKSEVYYLIAELNQLENLIKIWHEMKGSGRTGCWCVAAPLLHCSWWLVTASVRTDLRGDLAVGRLVGGLNEHRLGQLLPCRHRHLLDLIQLLQNHRKKGRDVCY